MNQHTKRFDLLQELSKERDAALDLLERADRFCDGQAEQGYMTPFGRALWADIREYLAKTP